MSSNNSRPVTSTTTSAVPVTGDGQPGLKVFIPSDPMPLGVAHLFVSLLVLASNVFAIIVMLRSRLANTKPSIFVLHLVACDMYRGCCALALSIYTLAVGRTSDSACQVFGFFGISSVTMATYAVPLLLYDRLLFVSSPVNYTHRMSKRVVVVLIVFNLLQGVLFGAIPLNSWGRYEYSDMLAACSLLWTDSGGYPALIVVWVHFLPLVCSVLCFVKIVIWMRRRICQVRMHTQVKVTWSVIRDQTFKEANLPMDMIGRTLFFVLAFYYISWFPYFFFVILLIASLGITSNASVVYVCMSTLTFVTSVANPWLYWLPSRRFRTNVMGMLPCSAQSAYTETEVSSITPARPRSESMFVLHNYPIGQMNVSTVTSC